MAGTITAAELAKLHGAGQAIELIDVRTPGEYRTAHVQFAKNVPLDQLDPSAIMRARNGDMGQLYVICQSGMRGRQACEKFTNAGFANVINVDGGTSACLATALPILRGKQVMSLERQVRIAAGSFVLIGAILGYFVHPYFIGLSAFIGAGLVFAGVTDTCGMAMMLAKLPWNR